MKKKQLTDWSPSPEELLISFEERKELRKKVCELLETLTEPAKQIVIKRYFDEMSIIQIAREMHLSEYAVKRKLKTALTELKRESTIKMIKEKKIYGI